MRDRRRRPIVVAMEWVSKITTISLEMALPPLAGHWLDDRWGTAPWMLVAGALLGMFVVITNCRDRLAGRSRVLASRKVCALVCQAILPNPRLVL